MTIRSFRASQQHMKSYSLPISLIRQYLFCPRIPYYQEIMRLNPARPIWVKQGNEYHQQQQRLFKDRTLKRFGLNTAKLSFNVEVNHEELGIHGIADCFIETPDKIYPVEFKLYGNKPTKSQIYQTIAYGLALAHTLQKPFDTAFILFEKKGKTHKIDVNNKLKQKVINQIDKIQNMLKDGNKPDSSASQQQCTQCEFVNYCNDRF